VCAGRRTRDGRRTHRRPVSPFRRHGDGRSTRTPSVCSYRPAAGRGLRDLQYGMPQVTTSARRTMVLHRRAAGPTIRSRRDITAGEVRLHQRLLADVALCHRAGGTFMDNAQATGGGRGASAPESFEVRVRARQPYFSHGLPSAVAQSWTPVSRSSATESRCQKVPELRLTGAPEALTSEASQTCGGVGARATGRRCCLARARDGGQPPAGSPSRSRRPLSLSRS
jgi:hypothetical protein